MRHKIVRFYLNSYGDVTDTIIEDHNNLKFIKLIKSNNEKIIALFFESDEFEYKRYTFTCYKEVYSEIDVDRDTEEYLDSFILEEEECFEEIRSSVCHVYLV